MKTKHTPGPWSVRETRGLKGSIYGPDARSVASVGNAQRSYEVLEANAQLIAAAPEMLARLKEIHSESGCAKDDPSWRGACPECVLIAKAEGNTK